MGYILEFYSVNRETISEKLKLRASFSNDQIFQEITSHLSLLDSTKNILLSEEAAFEFSTIVSQLGCFLGSLDHNSAGGQYFRETFINEIAAKCFQEPNLLDYLTHRSFDGLEGDGYPDWGWIKKSELLELTKNYHPPYKLLDDEDLEGWLEDLVILFKDAVDKGDDLITIYG